MKPGRDSSRIMILAGEPSGDVLGAHLVKAILQRRPEITIFGIGGDSMSDQGMELMFHIRDLSAMGATEVILQFSAIKEAFGHVRRTLRHKSPDLLILIDYPGFNLKAAAIARACNIAVLYYITPKVWAWKKSRLKIMKRVIDHAALIFPFEAELFRKAGIPHTFVGHPLLDLHPYAQHHRRKVKKNGFVIGFLPGSRKAEISSLLPVMLQVCQRLNQRLSEPVFLLSEAASVDRGQFEALVRTYDPQGLCTIVQGDPVRILEQADAVVATSGTVTLEAAIWGVPSLIVYKMSAISYFLARLFVKVPYAGLANIIAGREIAPELLQSNANPDTITEAALSLLRPETLASAGLQLARVRQMLGTPGAAARTAAIAMDLLDRKEHPAE